MAAGGILVFEHEGARGGATDDDGCFAEGQHGANQRPAGDEEVLGHQRVGGGPLRLLAPGARGLASGSGLVSSLAAWGDDGAENVASQRVDGCEHEEPE